MSQASFNGNVVNRHTIPGDGFQQQQQHHRGPMGHNGAILQGGGHHHHHQHSQPQPQQQQSQQLAHGGGRQQQSLNNGQVKQHQMQQQEAAVDQGGEVPLAVLGCPDCGFLCTSNNQMCRHMFLTCHGVHACRQCTARLICWAFAPGVQKLFVRAKKDGVMIDTPIFETAEKHQERTGHHNTHVPGKEKYVKPGKPEDYGLVINRPPPVDLVANANRYNCPQCHKSIATWTQMTKHLDNTKHALSRCVECDVVLKCYGMSQPIRHEKLTGHRGLVGLFRMKLDYLSNATGNPIVCQYGCPDCGISFLHPLHMAMHLSERHKMAFPAIKCGECGQQGSFSELCHHRLTSGHEKFVHTEKKNNTELEGQVELVDVPLDLDDYLISLPSPPLNVPDLIAHKKSGEQRSAGVVSTPSTTPLRPPPTPNMLTSSKILYQCPTCFYVAPSWGKLERHLNATKHTLAHCLQCAQFLPPLRTGSDMPHRFTSGHKILYGDQLQRSQYEMLVDCSDTELQCQINDSRGGTMLQQVTTGKGLMLHQCHAEHCRQVFLDAAALHRHWTTGQCDHGTVSCTCCEEPENEISLSTADQAWRKHKLHPQSEQVLLQAQEEDGGLGGDPFAIWASEEEVLEYHGDRFTRCKTCHLILEKAKMTSHVDSVRCAVLKTQRLLVDKANAASVEGKSEEEVDDILCSGVLPPSALTVDMGNAEEQQQHQAPNGMLSNTATGGTPGTLLPVPPSSSGGSPAGSISTSNGGGGFSVGSSPHTQKPTLTAGGYPRATGRVAQDKNNAAVSCSGAAAATRASATPSGGRAGPGGVMHYSRHSNQVAQQIPPGEQQQQLSTIWNS